MADKANFINELEKLCIEYFGKEWNVNYWETSKSSGYIRAIPPVWIASKGNPLEITILVHEEGE
jgi:hypothetical protein